MPRFSLSRASRPLLGCLTLAVLGVALGISARAQAADPPAPAKTPALPSDDLFTNPARSVHRFDDFVYTLNDRRAEANEKVARLRKLMAERKWDGVFISTERNLNWLSAGGKDNVVWVQRDTAAKLLVMADKLYLVANNIEAPRMMTEELDGLGYAPLQYNWHNPKGEADVLEPLLRGKKVMFDDVAAAATYVKTDPASSVLDFQPVYYPVTPGELKKYRWLGRKTSEVLEQVAPLVKPGMTEHDVQYLLAREFWYWDILPTVILSAADERFLIYRHPVVIGAPIKKLVALNVCTRRWGLTVSTTRVIHFGEPDAKLAQAWKDGAAIYGSVWAASKPGKTLGDALAAARKAYETVGFPDEWKLHHQGGMILGLERLYLVQPGDKTKIIPGMVLAWNPTVQGSKYEDTMVVNADGTVENLTPCLRWPTVEVKVGNTTFKAPGLMVRSAP